MNLNGTILNSTRAGGERFRRGEPDLSIGAPATFFGESISMMTKLELFYVLLFRIYVQLSMLLSTIY